jgi:tripartite-type tricarboxylate transporter receptor subunit TctC
MCKRKYFFELNSVLAVLLFACAEPLYAQSSYYESKTIRIIVGFSPGGGFDTYSRAIARHIGRHIPGNPTVIVENMTGAGSLIAGNYLYNQAKPDGLTIGHFIGGLVLGQVLGNPGVKFDARKFEWIGAPARLEGVFAFTTASGFTNLDKWRTSKTPAKLGATGPGSETHDIPKILQAAIGLTMQVISGYKGTSDIRLAAENGEIDGMCTGWESVKVGWRKSLDDGKVTVVLQALPAPHKDLPKVPLAIDLAKTNEARALIRVGVHDQSAVLRPYTLAPGTPKDRVRILREAFQATMQDKLFLAEAQKANLDINPLSGEELETTMNGFFKLEQSLVSKLNEILVPTK